MKRILARLEIKSEKVVKGIRMEGLRKINDPEILVKKYFDDFADEIILSDIVASLYDRNQLYDLVNKICKQINIPILVGGGIRSLEDALKLLRTGADKITINTKAVENSDLISDCANKLGSQCVVVEMHAKKKSNNNWEIFVENGRQPTGIDVKSWIKEVQNKGAGEILLISVDQDGVCKGPDYELIQHVENDCYIPLIYAGGISSVENVNRIFLKSKVDAISLSHILHFNKNTIRNIKKQLSKNNIDVRH